MITSVLVFLCTFLHHFLHAQLQLYGQFVVLALLAMLAMTVAVRAPLAFEEDSEEIAAEATSTNTVTGYCTCDPLPISYNNGKPVYRCKNSRTGVSVTGTDTTKLLQTC